MHSSEGDLWNKTPAWQVAENKLHFLIFYKIYDIVMFSQNTGVLNRKTEIQL